MPLTPGRLSSAQPCIDWHARGHCDGQDIVLDEDVVLELALLVAAVVAEAALEGLLASVPPQVYFEVLLAVGAVRAVGPGTHVQPQGGIGRRCCDVVRPANTALGRASRRQSHNWSGIGRRGK